MDLEKFKKFAETVAKRAYVAAHPDTFIAARLTLPRMMAALDRLVEATRGEYIPNKWCEPGVFYAMPIFAMEFGFPKLSDDFRPISFTERYGLGLLGRPYLIGITGA